MRHLGRSISTIVPILYCAAIVFPPAANGDVHYEFSYIASSGSIQSFDIDVTSPVFITGGSIAFQPVDVTDGITTWTLTAGVSGQGIAGGCFEFGTALARLLVPCGYAIPQDIDTPIGAVYFLFAGGLPTSVGTYLPRPAYGTAHEWGGSFFLHPGVGSGIGDDPTGANTGSATLIISSTPTEAVPEPMSGFAVLTVITIVCSIESRRRTHHRRS